MKKLYVTLIAFMLAVGINAQVISIGTDVTPPTSGSQFRSPWSAVYDFSYVQTIYLQSEINVAGNITSISYKFDGPTLANSNQLEVYMGTTSKTAFDGSYTDWVPTSAMTLVFNSTISAVVPGWINITLTTPYAYQNNGNLVIAIHEKSPNSDYVSGLQANAFEVTDMGTNRVMYFVTDAADAPDPDPANPPTADNIRTKVGNIRITISGAQPVGLSDFNATRQPGFNALSWVTKSEQHNKGFAIERSVDGVDFNEIGFVNSKGIGGNSNDILNYTYSDARPLKGNNYYRLRQIDFDGKVTFSKVAVVKGLLNNLFSITTIYPNPVREGLNIILNAESENNAQVMISDMSGKVVWKGDKTLIAGDNKISINASSFASGIYNVRATLSGTHEVASGTFIKN